MMVLMIVKINFEVQVKFRLNSIFMVMLSQLSNVRSLLNPIFIEKYMLKATNLAFKIDAMTDIVVMSGLATCAAPIF